MIYDGCHFVYGDLKSRKYGLIIGHVDTSYIDDMIGTTESSTIYNKKGLKRYFIGDKYSDSPVSYDVEIVTDGESIMTLDARKEAERELFYQVGYKKLYVDIVDDVYAETYDIIDGEQKALYLNARFINPVKILDGAGVTVGYKCTMECDSMMFHQDSIIDTFDITTTQGQIVSVYVDSNISEYIYPIIKVTMNSDCGSNGGYVQLSNMTDDEERFTRFEGFMKDDVLTIDNEHNYAKSSLSQASAYSRMTKRNFFRLLPGTNQIYVVGTVSNISIEFTNRRFM